MPFFDVKCNRCGNVKEITVRSSSYLKFEVATNNDRRKAILKSGTKLTLTPPPENSVMRFCRAECRELTAHEPQVHAGGFTIEDWH